MGLEGIVKFVGKQTWLDPVGDLVQKGIAGAFAAAGQAEQPVKDFMNGVWLGHPLHPALIDVPLGAWTAALVLDTLEAAGGSSALGSGADACVTIGVIGAAGAAVSGLSDWQYTTDEPRRIGSMHALLNTSSLVLYVISLTRRVSGSRGSGRGFALFGFSLAMAASYLGGDLVYSQRIGVDHARDQPPPEDFVSVLTASDLAVGEKRRVEANGMPLLLVRQQDRVYALADTCSHLGGPLSEGEIKDNSVICPWHGSCFALEDGKILNGPSTYRQPSLEVRERNGQIEVRGARG
ncbi:MAG: Rieske 2Fe-2S domain-containing protein [Dehalococcoidia bacterium]